MSRTGWYRVALSGLLVVVIVWLWWTRVDELVYHTVGRGNLVELGDATSFSEQQGKIPENSYVSVTGILGNKAATLSGLRAGSFRMGRYQVRHLLGSKLYVEFDEAQYRSQFSPFTRITVSGRLTSFGPGSELEKVRKFFKDYYNQTVDDKAMLIVVDERPRSEPIYAIMFIVSLLVIVVSVYSSVRMWRNRAQDNVQDNLE